jgi:MoaA/NifB/PqqE/SkfB family radical SAM enzyme
MHIGRVSWSVREEWWPPARENVAADEGSAADADVLREVIVEITNRCHLNCRMCIRQAWEAEQGDMPRAAFQELLAQLQTFPTVATLKFGGYGEPLLHPDFFAMVEAAHRQGLRTVATTNGMLLTEERAGRLVDSGLDALYVSVDGVSPEAYADIRQGGEWAVWQSHLEGLRRLKERSSRTRPDVGLAFVAMRRNVSDMARLRILAQQVGASEILITNLLPHTAELKDEILYGAWVPTARTPGSSTVYPQVRLPWMDWRPEVFQAIYPLVRFHPRFVLADHSIAVGQSRCPFIASGAAAITWQGQVSPCPPLMYSYRCYVLGHEKQVYRYRVGDLREWSLAEVWNDEPYAQFRARVRAFDFPPCVDCRCELLDTNETDCFDNPFPVCGHCLWARGILQCP